MHLCGHPGEGLFGGAPPSADGESSPSAGAFEEFPADPGSPASAGAVQACSAPLSDIMAQLWETTDPLDLADMLSFCPPDTCTSPAPDDSEPDEPCPDTDSSAASSKMGEEHVMELIEHIITTCTPVAEAHALLAILTKAGTVPWKTLAPYLKVLREWHHECGRRPVLSKDLRIPVCAAVTLAQCVLLACACPYHKPILCAGSSTPHTSVMIMYLSSYNHVYSSRICTPS